VLAPTNASAIYGGTKPLPTWQLETSGKRDGGHVASVAEHYARGVGFVAHAFHGCSDTICDDATIKLVSWSFTQPFGHADRRCREDLTGDYDNGVSLMQRGTAITGTFDQRVGTHGWHGTISGTRTATTVSLHYLVNDELARAPVTDVKDYVIDRTGLALQPGDPSSPTLMRTCTFGEL
jgi:hypothetical protein